MAVITLYWDGDVQVTVNAPGRVELWLGADCVGLFDVPAFMLLGELRTCELVAELCRGVLRAWSNCIHDGAVITRVGDAVEARLWGTWEDARRGTEYYRG